MHPVLKCLEPRPMATTRLICVPHAGAGASAYRPWLRYLPADIELYAVQLPGREDRLNEPVIADWSELSAGFAEIASSIPFGRIAIYGHSMGALAGLALARILTATIPGRLRHLFCAAYPWPGIAVPDADLEKMSDEGFLDMMEERYGGAGLSMDNPEIRSLALPVLRADMSLLQTFKYEEHEALPVSLTVLYGEKDPLSQQTDYSDWAQETSAAFTLHPLKDGHLFHQTRPAETAALVSAALAA